MNFKDMTQEEIVLWHLETRGSISQKEAASRYGDYRLSDKILKLRKKGKKYIKHTNPKQE